MRNGIRMKGFTVGIITLFVGAGISPLVQGFMNQNVEIKEEKLLPRPFIDEKISGVFDEIDQSQTKFNGWFGSPGMAQTFKPSMEYLTKITLYLRKKNTPNDLTVSIRDAGSKIDLVMMKKSVNDIPDTFTWIEFDFDDIILQPGKPYYIVCLTDLINFDNLYYWGAGYNDPYENGNAYTSTDEGNTWGKITYNGNPIDYCFITYGTSIEPTKPTAPAGPEEGKIGEELTYSTNTTDPFKKQLFFQWDWGNGEISDWLGPYNSDEIVSISHSWTDKGIYVIKVKAKNVDGYESDWSDPLIIGIPVKNNGEDQSQETCDGHSYGVFSSYAFAQSFIPNQNTLTNVQLYISKNGNPDTLKISIRKELTEDDLTSVEKQANGFPDEKAKWIEFDFPDIAVDAGSTYYIVWTPGNISDKDNLVYWLFGENDRYSSGRTWEGYPWEEFNPSQYTDIDFCFKTYSAKSKNQQLIDTDWADIKWLFERFPDAFPLLRQLRGY